MNEQDYLQERLRELQHMFLDQDTRAAAAQEIYNVVKEYIRTKEQAKVLLKFVKSILHAPERGLCKTVSVLAPLLAGDELLDFFTEVWDGYSKRASDHRLSIISMVDESLHYCLNCDLDDFVICFLDGVRSEKDPFCILHLFGIIEQLISKHNMDAEDLFICISRYFPITFSSSRDIPVTPQQLKSKLARVLSQPGFAYELIPFMLEKMPRWMDSVKAEALQILLLSTYGDQFPVVDMKNLLLGLLVDCQDMNLRELIFGCIKHFSTHTLWSPALQAECVSMLSADERLASLAPLILQAIDTNGFLAKMDFPLGNPAWMCIAITLEQCQVAAIPADLVNAALELPSEVGLDQRVKIRVLSAMAKHLPVKMPLLNSLAQIGPTDELSRNDLKRAFGICASDEVVSFALQHIDNEIIWHMACNQVIFKALQDNCNSLPLACHLASESWASDQFVIEVITKCIDDEHNSELLETVMKMRVPQLSCQEALLQRCKSVRHRSYILYCSKPLVADHLLDELGAASMANKTGLIKGSVTPLLVKALMIKKDQKAVDFFLSLSDCPDFLASANVMPFSIALHHEVHTDYLRWFVQQVLLLQNHCIVQRFLYKLQDGQLFEEIHSQIDKISDWYLMKRMIDKEYIRDLSSVATPTNIDVHQRYALCLCLESLIDRNPQLGKIRFSKTVCPILIALQRDRKVVVRDAANRCMGKWVLASLAGEE